jgi:hypothetical protein
MVQLRAAQKSSFIVAQLWAKANESMTDEEFSEACASAGIAVQTAKTYAKVGSDEGIEWAVYNNIIGFNIGVLAKLTGIPLDEFKREADKGAFVGLSQKNASEVRRNILGDRLKPANRKPKYLVDDWPEEWRKVAGKLILLNLAASSLRAQIGICAAEMIDKGMSSKEVSESLMAAIKENLANSGVGGTGETCTVNGKSLKVIMAPSSPEGCLVSIEVKG